MHIYEKNLRVRSPLKDYVLKQISYDRLSTNGIFVKPDQVNCSTYKILARFYLFFKTNLLISVAIHLKFKIFSSKPQFI